MDPHVHFDIIKGFLDFYPILNENMAITTVRLMALFGIDISNYSPHPVLFTAFAALLIGAVCFMSRYFIYIGHKSKKFIHYFLVFAIAGTICSTIDTVFRGGSIDYIGLFDWFIFDLKDMYLNIGIAFLLLYNIQYYRGYFKLSKEERKQVPRFIKWMKMGCPKDA
jgi:signal peptidase II